MILLVALKSVASAVSIGSGFRGGLFFASLFLGALLGKAFAGLHAAISAEHAVSPLVCALVGMSGLAVAVVGGPLTMGFLALEATGNLPMTVAVLAACVVSSLTVRRTFGYSFATWRFHLRGEAIRSAVDIGWMRNLTVGRMMRREVRSLRGIVSQQLVPRADGQVRALALEILLRTEAVASCIRKGETYMLPGIMQTGGKMGMRLMDDSLVQLYKEGTITAEEAYMRSEQKSLMRTALMG